METKINIMTLDVDIISYDILTSKIKEYLDNDVFNIVLFATSKLLKITTESEELRESICDADLILPGDESILEPNYVDEFKNASLVINPSYLRKALTNIISEERTIYIITRNEKEEQLCIDYVTENYHSLNVVGTFHGDLEISEEIVINDINSVTPDILLILLNSPLQERFIMGNRQKMNSKLGICLGDVNLEHFSNPNKPSNFLTNWKQKFRNLRIFN